jgi:hypothetical protein
MTKSGNRTCEDSEPDIVKYAVQKYSREDSGWYELNNFNDPSDAEYLLANARGGYPKTSFRLVKMTTTIEVLDN